MRRGCIGKARGRVVHFPRGATIIREFSHGTGYFLLLEGRIFAHSKRRDFDIALRPGKSFDVYVSQVDSFLTLEREQAGSL